jgi:hypothetical protein
MTPESSSLSVVVKGQHTDQWCWAASGQMCMEYLGGSVTQCDEANRQFTRTDCCTDPVTGNCVKSGWPEFDKYGFTSSLTNNTALSWDEITNQIYCQKKPVTFSWAWDGGGGHMMVLTGYQVISGVKYVTIIDPLPVDVGDQKLITYDEYVSSPGDHTHWNDYYNITKQ